VVSREGQKTVTALVVNVVLPCNIVIAFMTELSPELLKDCAVILVVSLVIQAGGVLYGKFAYKGQERGRQNCLRYGIICSNAGFLGNPVAEGLYGPTGLMLASIYLIPQRIMMWSEGLRIFSGESDGKKLVRKVLLHPCIIACIIGCILMAGQLRLPEWIYRPVNTLGRCNTALSMMVIGMILAEVDPKNLVDKTVVRYTVDRLVIIPLVVLIACRICGFSHIVTGLSVILAAMPCGATTTMLAVQYRSDPEFATKLVVFSTLCSIPSICVWSLLLH